MKHNVAHRLPGLSQFTGYQPVLAAHRCLGRADGRGLLVPQVTAYATVAGLCGLVFLADLLSRPVLVDHMTGVAVIMIRSFISGLGSVHAPTVALSVAVLAATATVWVLTLDDKGIRLACGIPAVGVAVVAFSHNALTARTFAARQGEVIAANAELRALGVCNLTTGVTQSFPVSSSGASVALGDAVGSRTQLYSLVTLATVLLVTLAGRDLLEHFPMAALGALVVYATLRLIDERTP